MLVLTRKVGDKIVIEVPGREPILIMLARIDGNQARIGVEAPRDYRILREEVTAKLA